MKRNMIASFAILSMVAAPAIAATATAKAPAKAHFMAKAKHANKAASAAKKPA